MGGACSTHGRDEKCIKTSVRKPEGKRPHGRPQSRQEDNIKMDLREIRGDDVGWIHLAEDRDHCQ
jgi:hypothetical protein